MDVIKTLLAGCGALAILGLVGCVGMVGVGTYAIDQQLRENEISNAVLERESSAGEDRRRNNQRRSEDPFGEYNAGQDSVDSFGDTSEGWGNEAK